MKRVTFSVIILLFLVISPGDAIAHFGMLIPSDSMVMQGDKRLITIVLSFSHPFELVR